MDDFFLVKVREIFLISCRNLLYDAFVIIVYFNDPLVHEVPRFGFFQQCDMKNYYLQANKHNWWVLVMLCYNLWHLEFIPFHSLKL